jgi:hypothetical protein
LHVVWWFSLSCALRRRKQQCPHAPRKSYHAPAFDRHSSPLHSPCLESPTHICKNPAYTSVVNTLGKCKVKAMYRDT